MSEPITSVTIAKFLVFGAASLMGGIAHILVEFRKGKIKNKKDGLALLFVSTFAGAVWCVISLKFYGDDILLAIFAGMFGGFMSLEGLAIAFSYLKNKFLIK